MIFDILIFWFANIYQNLFLWILNYRLWKILLNCIFLIKISKNYRLWKFGKKTRAREWETKDQCCAPLEHENWVCLRWSIIFMGQKRWRNFPKSSRFGHICPTKKSTFFAEIVIFGLCAAWVHIMWNIWLAQNLLKEANKWFFYLFTEALFSNWDISKSNKSRSMTAVGTSQICTCRCHPKNYTFYTEITAEAPAAVKIFCDSERLLSERGPMFSGNTFETWRKNFGVFSAAPNWQPPSRHVPKL